MGTIIGKKLVFRLSLWFNITKKYNKFIFEYLSGGRTDIKAYPNYREEPR